MIKEITDEIASDLESGANKMWAYYLDGTIAGVISTRDISHISLLYVNKHFHRRGIARALLGTVLEEVSRFDDMTQITVNASPYAVNIYEHLGFQKVGEQQEKDGIIFTPMVRRKDITL